MGKRKYVAPIYTSQQLMEILGYPSGTECPFKELFDEGFWCGWWSENGDIFEFGVKNNDLTPKLIPDLKDHTKSTFYSSKIIESGLCEDYGINIIPKNGGTFISHTQPHYCLVDPRYAMYHLKKYVPLVKSSNKAN